MDPIRIVLVDDHLLIREGLKVLINAQPDMVVVGEASDGHAACQHVCVEQPSVVIMDITMPILNGVQTTILLRRKYPDLKILVLSVHDDTSYLRQLLVAGASGYVLKHTAAVDLIQAIRVVIAGGVYIDTTLVPHVVAGYVRHPTVSSALLDTTLSEREIEVVRGIARGYSHKEIATQLSVSVKTIETYRARAMEKLGCTSRAALVRYALDQGWLHTT